MVKPRKPGWSKRGAVLLALGFLLPSGAWAQAGSKAAGKISARIPVSHVLRGTKSFDAEKDFVVNWNDIVKTERGGRARVRLDDGSILNVGSQSQLRIQEHDAAVQRTTLQLAYGRMRASVVRISNPSGSFQVRTSAAVAGVVGTDEYVEATDIVTTVIALGGGQVTVGSTDSRFTETVVLDPGEAVTLVAGRPPGPKRAATAEELVKAVQETEVDSVVQLNPNRTLAGRTFTATLQGRGLSNATGMTSPVDGILVQMTSQPTATQVEVSISVAASVSPGTYNLTVERPEGPALASLVVTTEEAQRLAAAAAAQVIEMPPSQSLSAIRGAKFQMDASATRPATGTQIVSYQWTVLNTSLQSNAATFLVNTSLLPPGNYTIQLVVITDAGQTGVRQFPLTVNAGTQPAEIVQRIALAYESLQPDRFLAEFDQQRFRNFAGFEAAIQDSFRNQLETMRVFERPVNCTTLEEQDQAVCQADFELRFTQKNQPTELLDPQGNPVPPGTTPPPGSTLGKRLQVGNERITLRYDRGNAGWKITDYAAIVTCPGGASTTGLNVGSCIIAAGSPVTPSFQLSNVQVFSPDLPLGGSVGGTFDVVPLGGFAGTISFSAQGSVGGQNVSVQFNPNPSGASGTVSFTVIAPTTPPANFTGPLPFTLVLTGTDSSGTITNSANVAMVLQPNFTLTISPSTSSGTPIPAQHNTSFVIDVQVIPGTGFSGTVFVDFPNLPAGFAATPGNVPAGSTTRFTINVTSAAVPGPAIVNVRATVSTGLVKTQAVFVDVTSDFSVVVSPATSSTNPAQVNANRTLNLTVQVLPVLGFAGSVLIDFPNLPAGFSGTPATLPAGGSAVFGIFVNATTPIGLYTMTVRGSVGGASPKTVTVFVQVLVALIPIKPPTEQEGLSDSSAKTAPASAPRLTISSLEPQRIEPGASTEVVIYGENLQSAKSVSVSGSGVTAQVVEAQPGELRVRLTAQAGVIPGARLLAIETNAGRVTATLEIMRAVALAGDAPSGELLTKRARSPRLQDADGPPLEADARPENGTADLVVRREDISMSPASPQTGDTVTLRVLVSNEGRRAAEGFALELVVDGTLIRQREIISLQPQESQTVTFEWVVPDATAAAAVRMVPRVTLDPDGAIAESSRANNHVTLPAILLQKFSGPVPGPATGSRKSLLGREQMQMQLVPGACVGLRLNTAQEAPCDSGDLVIRVSASGDAAVLESEKVLTVGNVTLSAAAQRVSTDAANTSAALLANTAYVLEVGQKKYALRVVTLRAAQNSSKAAPEPLRAPSLKGADVDVRRGPRANAMLLVIEWVRLP
jgi:hypothetical protein